MASIQEQSVVKDVDLLHVLFAASKEKSMTFEGSTDCPVCGDDISRELKDVCRKADDDDYFHIECPRCDANIVIHLQIKHHVTLTKDEES